MKKSKVKVYDFFSGCGGASHGFQTSGMEISFALDFDKHSVTSFSANFPKAVVVNEDIRSFQLEDFRPYFDRDALSLFCACAPCQPFSRLKKASKAHDDRIYLLSELSNFIKEFLPDFVFIENVSGIQKRYSNGPLSNFLVLLDDLGYKYESAVVNAKDYGVPQNRSRLIVVAAKNYEIVLPRPTHGQGKKDYATVKDYIGNLNHIEAGETCKKDPLHRAAGLSSKTMERIRATPPEQGRESWPEHLRLRCHANHRGHSDVYGRMSWDKPANTLTTRCHSLSNGRFGHPEQNRAISLREAALLQSFPVSFKVIGTSLDSMARQIGNAVPPLLTQMVGKQLLKLLDI